MLSLLRQVPDHAIWKERCDTNHTADLLAPATISGFSLLHLVAGKGDAQILQLLEESGLYENLEDTDSIGFRPIH
jgi:hypothetical protein